MENWQTAPTSGTSFKGGLKSIFFKFKVLIMYNVESNYVQSV